MVMMFLMMMTGDDDDGMTRMVLVVMGMTITIIMT